MAQSGMRDIKRRIKSVNSTKQITKAMELVATAKLRRVKDRVESARPYFTHTQEVISYIITNTKGIKHPFLVDRGDKRALYVVVTGDRGFAGGYNSNVLKLAQSEMQSRESSVICVGRKSNDFFKSRGYNVLESYIGISENPTIHDAREISKLLIEQYKRGKVDSVYLVYTEFVSTMTQRPMLKRLLPVEKLEAPKSKTLISFEPSPEETLAYIIPKYIVSTVYGGMIESAASEQGARRNAMSSATDNATEMIEELTLYYNRARQAAVTKEISEIVSGADALK